jgi:hypothetical protein
MWGDKHGEFHFAASPGISLQKLHMKFFFESNFQKFKYWNVNIVRNGCYNIFTIAQDTIYFYVKFIINLVISFIIYLILVNVLFFKYYTCLVDTKFCKLVRS